MRIFDRLQIRVPVHYFHALLLRKKRGHDWPFSEPAGSIIEQKAKLPFRTLFTSIAFEAAA